MITNRFRPKRIQNSQGDIFYGCHMYPGVAEYAEPGKPPRRVFLNEATIRSMDPTFAARPVFVLHVDDVDADLDTLRGEADGWVVESFYNAADGKHWVKFLVVSERGKAAVKAGMRLSNAYLPKSFGKGGLWNGVTYNAEVTSGEYEHLAIVPNPRYDESVIMTPDEFKAYNEEQTAEVRRLANSHSKEPRSMKLPKVFKREKIENSALDLEATIVLLPKSSREVSLATVCNEADELAVAAEKPQMANGDHLVDVGGTKMTVNDLMAKYKTVCDELAAKMAEPVDDGDTDADDTDPAVDNEDDDEVVPNAEEEAAAKKKADDDKAAEKTKNAADKAKAKAKAQRLANAHKTVQNEAQVFMSDDMVARGKSRYGS